MNKPHKHAALIKAWADGAKIQYKENGNWVDWNSGCSPSWLQDADYRIKPNTIKYRLYVYARAFEEVSVHICTDPTLENTFEKSVSFIKWLGDWQEVEV